MARVPTLPKIPTLADPSTGGLGALGSGSGFSPTSISGLVGWFKADAGVYSDTALTTLISADGTQVKGWKDQSSGANNFLLTSVGTATGPTYKTAIANGLPVLRFNGSTDLLRSSGLAVYQRTTQNVTIFIAFSQATNTGTQTPLSWNTAAQASDYGYFLSRNASAQKSHRTFADTDVTDSVDIGSVVAVQTLTYDGTNQKIYTNLDAGASGASGSRPAGTDQVILGGLQRTTQNPNGTFFLNGDVCEIIVYSNVVSAANQTAVINYLSARWVAAPGAPTSLAGTGGYLSNYLTWAAPANATSYIVKRSAAGAGTYTTVASGVTTLYYFDMSLSSNTAYDYQVQAVNQFGRAGTAASVANVTTISGAFDPTKFGTISRWGKPDALGLANNALIATNTDQSATGNNFVQATGGNKPTYKTNVQNGLGMALYDGTSSYMTCNGMATIFSAAQPVSVFMVVKLTDLTGHLNADNRNYFIAANKATGTANATFDFYYAPFSRALAHSDRRDTAGTEYSAGFGDPDTSAHVVGLIYDGTSVQFYVDGTLTASRAHGTGAMTFTDAGLTMGAHLRLNVITAYFNGYIGEEVWYPFACNATQVSILSTYFVNRWATPNGMASDPSQFSGLGDWIRDDCMNGLGTLANGASLATVYSKSMFNGDFNNSGTVTYQTNIQNSRAMALFGGGALVEASAGTVAALVSGGGPYTIFWTSKASVAAATESFWSLTNNGASNAFSCARKNSTGPTFGLGTQNDASVANSATGGTPDTAAHSYILVDDGKTGILYVDGVATVTNTRAVSGAAFTFIRCVLGGLYRGSLTEPFAGYLGEWGCINRALSAGEITTLSAYQRNWWATP